MNELQQQLANLASQISDEEVLKRYAKSIQKIADGEGDDLAKLAQLRDEHKQLKQELEKIYEIVSFHLGSPLKSLAMLATMLKNDMQQSQQLSPMVVQLAQHLDAQVDKLHESMGNLIIWADLSVKNFSVYLKEGDLQPAIHKAFESAEGVAMKKRVNLSLSVTGTLKATFDEKMMARVLTNLLSNAVKFTPSDGYVNVEAKEVDKGVEVRIADNGVGMGSVKLANVFNPSRKSTQRGTANEMGLGMGLIVAKGLLELHQTYLSVESEQGKGTVVSFVLNR